MNKLLTALVIASLASGVIAVDLSAGKSHQDSSGVSGISSLLEATRDSARSSNDPALSSRDAVLSTTNTALSNSDSLLSSSTRRPADILAPPRATERTFSKPFISNESTASKVPTTSNFDWPSGAEVPVLRQFSVGSERWSPGHRGVDLALGPGAPVYAAADGRVVYAGVLNDRALVSIEHDNGLRTTYEPLDVVVKRGQTVVRGQLIGMVTDTHCGISSCLHWGAKYEGDRYIDPLSLLMKQPIRLYR